MAPSFLRGLLGTDGEQGRGKWSFLRFGWYLT